MAVVALVFVDAGQAPLGRGSAAPDFELRVLGTAEGTAEARLALDDLRGRVVLVNFWKTTCKPCEQEMPAMERLYRILPRDQFELVAVASDPQESLVQAFQDEYQLSFPIVLDPGEAVTQRYETMGVPETWLIDRDGRLVERYIGPREWDEAEHVDRLRALIREGGA